MKTPIKPMIIAFITTALSVFVPAKLQAQGASVSFQVFYDELDPYGQWVEYPSYGYVWVPAAGPDFMPYSSSGYWAWTEYGWTWVSDYSWGWAPFHYGRWDYLDYYGWVWIPGNEWGPAWVVWRHSPGYYGWAPISPGITVNVAIGGGYYPPHDHWVFVNNQYMGNREIHQHYGPRTNNQNYINNSTVINNTYVDNSTHTTYITGPRSEEVQKETGRAVKPVAVRKAAKPGQSLKGNQLDLYRPEIAPRTEKVRPAKVAEKKDVAPISERKRAVNPNAIARPAQPAKRNAAQPAGTTTPAKKQPANKINKAVPENRNNNQNNTNKPVQRQTPVQPQKRVQQQPQQQKPVQRQQPVNPQQQRKIDPPRQAPANPPENRRQEPQVRPQQPQQQPQQPQRQPQQQPQPQQPRQQPQNVQPPVPQQQPPIQRPTQRTRPPRN